MADNYPRKDIIAAQGLARALAQPFGTVATLWDGVSLEAAEMASRKEVYCFLFFFRTKPIRKVTPTFQGYQEIQKGEIQVNLREAQRMRISERPKGFFLGEPYHPSTRVKAEDTVIFPINAGYIYWDVVAFR